MVLSQVTLAASAGTLAVALAVTAAAAPAHADEARSHRRTGARTASHPFLPGTPAVPSRPDAAAARTSANWSGYAASGATHTSVSSSWVEPTVVCTSNGIAAFWVGLDGVGSSTVEQDGTGADCSTGSPAYFAWWETYPENSMQEYRDPVAPGDMMKSSVASLGGGLYELELSDTTKGWTESKQASSPGALNSSAEIVAEAVTEGGSVSALPDFGSVRFTGSRIDNASPLAAGAQPIDMTGTDGTTLAATGPMDQAGDFTITYQHAPGLLTTGRAASPRGRG
jgi:hypothetical protein